MRLSSCARSTTPLFAAFFVVLWPLSAQQPSIAAPVAATGTITGRVVDPEGAALGGARVLLVALNRGAVTGENGRFMIAGVPPGTHLIRIARVGYTPSAPDSVVVAASASEERDYVLQPIIVALSRMVIAPGSYAILDQGAPSLQLLSRDQLLTAPQLAEDLFRSLNRLPGFSGSDFSAKMRIRNGAQDEQLVLLDGMELIEPFHLKDFDGALSILDAESIGRVELTTGGFGAPFGNHTTGLLQLFSAMPDEGRARFGVGVSFSNARARSTGTFAGGKGAWLASARRGYLDVVFKLIDEKDAPDPRYYDLFGKVQYQLGTRNVVALHALFAGDELTFDDGDGEQVRSSYNNLFTWATLRTQVSERLALTTLASFTGLSWKRDGTDYENFQQVQYQQLRINDRRQLNVAGLKQDWTFDFSRRWSALAGGEWRSEGADYRYDRMMNDRALVGQQVILLDSRQVTATADPSGARTSGYVSLRGTPTKRLTTEIGVRGDHHAWTSETTVAPRLNAMLDVGRGTVLRGAWGIYPQAQGLEDLSIVDGDTAFAKAERAEQRILGIEKDFGGGWNGRAEAFERVIRNPRPRWYNTDGDLSALPEGAEDRILLAPSSGRVRGLELLATYDRGDKLRATASYVLSDAKQIMNGRETARPYDERHSAALDLSYHTGHGWTWAIAWTGHSGWPHIPGELRVDTISPVTRIVSRAPSQPYFTERLDGYQRTDVRVSRSFSVRGGRASFFAEIFNLFNAGNQRGWTYTPRFIGGTPVMQREREEFLPRLPSLGVRWEF